MRQSVDLKASHPRERGDPEAEFFQVLKAKDKRKVNLLSLMPILKINLLLSRGAVWFYPEQ